jgi:hypothetical protein
MTMFPKATEKAPDVPAALLTALFDGVAEARAAADRLAATGIDRGAIRLIPEDNATPGGAAPPAGEAGGVWGALASLRLPDADRYGYAEGVRRGGVLLAVSVAACPDGEIVRALEETGAVDLDERESEWWASGWRGYRPGGRTGEAAGAAAESLGPPGRDRRPGGARVRRYRAFGTG